MVNYLIVQHIAVFKININLKKKSIFHFFSITLNDFFLEQFIYYFINHNGHKLFKT